MATKELGNVKVELSNEHCGTDADGHTWLEYWDGAWRAQCGHRRQGRLASTRCPWRLRSCAANLPNQSD